MSYQGTHQVSKQTNDSAISSKEDGSRILNSNNSVSGSIVIFLIIHVFCSCIFRQFILNMAQCFL